MTSKDARPSRAWLSVLWLPLVLTCTSGCTKEPMPEVETWQQPSTAWVEVWRDDFEGAPGTAPDESRWTIEERPSGQNHELDYDTLDRKNSFLDGSGNLVIRALAEHYVDKLGATSGQPYTSARLNTHGKLEQAYGKFEARIKLPTGGKGVWPAFWLLGSDVHETGWPECGEVDILELHGSRPTRVDGSLHGPGYSAGDAYHGSYELASGKFGDAFHVFTFEWTAQGTRWLVDGEEYYVKTTDGVVSNGQRWVYDHPFFIILNLAIGGTFDGNPDATTVFPQEMLIDYVSVSELE